MSVQRFGLSHFDAVDTSGQPSLEDGERLAGTFTEIDLKVGDETDAGTGTLYITTTRIIWTSLHQPSRKYYVLFPAITMHAVSQEPEPCIYAQLEATVSEEEDEEDAEEELYPEIRLVPRDATMLQPMFEALCECAALNPDTEEDDNDEGNFFYNEDEVLNGIGADGRAAMLNRLDALLDDTDAQDLQELTGEDPERFEDPVDDEEVDEETPVPTSDA